jgi:NAD(P)-dependent dehydrogenase (short-subunit alcohol dehydrogenase family)
LTKSAAIDYATSGVRINAVAPGAVKTDIYQYAIDAGVYTEKEIAKMMPMGQLGAPIDIATGISFLLNNNFATGTILSIDGGYNAI